MKRSPLLLIALVALFGFNACTSEDDVVFVAQPDAEGIAFTSSVSSEYVLTTRTAGNTAERFVWNLVDFGVPTNINYELQASITETFGDAYTLLGRTTENNLAVSVQQLLDLAAEAGLDNDPATEAPNTGTVYVRVEATAGTAGEMAHTSEALSLNLVLPEATGEEEVDEVDLYMVGAATAAGEKPNNNNTPLFRDPANPDLYYFTGYFNAGWLKFLETTGWAPMYGVAADGTTLVYRETEADPDPASIMIETAGYYSLTVDLANMTVSVTPYDASSATEYTAMGVIGVAQAGAWDTDTDMIQSTLNPHIWYVNDISLSAGEFKFRANDAWDDNWGTASEALSGQTTYGSPDNMVAKAGTYDIWFNDLTGWYILIPQVTP